MTEDNKTILANLAVTIGEKEESIHKLTNRINELTEQCNELNRKASVVSPDQMRRYFRCLDESDEDCALCPFSKECDIFAQHVIHSSLCHFMANMNVGEGKRMNLTKTYEEIEAEILGAKDEIERLGKILAEKDATITELRKQIKELTHGKE